MFNDEFKARYTTIPFAVCRTYANENTFEVITHQHRELELISVHFGSADFYVNSVLCHLEGGDVLIIPPYALHRAVTSSDMPTSYSCICFDTELLCDGELKRGIKVASGGFISKNEPYTAAIRNYVENAVSACEEKYVGWELDAVGNMSLLFSAVKKDLKLTEKAANHKEANFGRVAMNYIIENYHSAATSRDAADAMHMNHSYFCRMFKKTFGCCFANYVLAYRLEKAQAFLKSTSLSVTEVAFKVGFNNCSYFGKTFRERFGVTPLDMKKRNAIRASES